jgi:hypothetical protein
MERAREAASETASKAQQEAKARAAKGKDKAASQMDDMAQALRSTGEELRQRDQQAPAQWSDEAAARIEELSQTLREKDVDEMVRDVESFARRQPELFVGAAFALGLLAARFLKSSDRPILRAPQQETSGSPGVYEHPEYPQHPGYPETRAVQTSTAYTAEPRPAGPQSPDGDVSAARPTSQSGV